MRKCARASSAHLRIARSLVRRAQYLRETRAPLAERDEAAAERKEET